MALNRALRALLNPTPVALLIELDITVRDLVAFCHRAGDIDQRFTPSPTGVQGIAGHQQVYRRRGDTYRSEYPVAYDHFEDDLQLRLRGRADGFDPAVALVEEVKTCRIRPALIPATVSQMHLAQARIYAALIAIEQDLDELEVRLTWFNIDLSLIHISEPTRLVHSSRMPSSA